MDQNKAIHLYVRTKTWIENDLHDLLFGKGKTEILELIEQEGSIAKAAEEKGIQWPCPTKEHPGTTTLYTDLFARAGGLATFMPLDHQGSG